MILFVLYTFLVAINLVTRYKSKPLKSFGKVIVINEKLCLVEVSLSTNIGDYYNCRKLEYVFHRENLI